MPIKMKPIREVPQEAFQRRTRSSVCTDTIEAIKKSDTQKAEIKADTAEELDKFYKTLIQWRSRHKDQDVNFRKAKDVLYIWIGEAKEDPEAKDVADEPKAKAPATKKPGTAVSQKAGRSTTA
jgi:uncharacterized protein (UPF0305 family)